MSDEKINELILQLKKFNSNLYNLNLILISSDLGVI